MLSSKCILVILVILILGVTELQAYGQFGDGIFNPAKNGNGPLALSVSHMALIKDTNDTIVKLRLYNANTNHTIPHVTYLLEVTKHDKMIMIDWFHSHSGELTMQITPTTTLGKWVILGDQEPFLGGWMQKDNSPLRIYAPIFEKGIYHIHTEILTIYNDKNLFTLDETPKFDSWINMGCPDGFVSVTKSSDHNDVCVKPSTVQKLVERGWGVLVEPTVKSNKIIQYGTLSGNVSRTDYMPCVLPCSNRIYYPSPNYEVDVFTNDGVTLVGKTFSDAHAHYSIQLPAGNYTIIRHESIKQNYTVSVFAGKNTVFNIIYGDAE
ncbi:MAG: hypothetical protein ACREBI_11770 [Nitrosotalea sp.]